MFWTGASSSRTATTGSDWPALYAVARETGWSGSELPQRPRVDCLGLEARRSRISNATPNSKSGCWTKSSPRRSPASSPKGLLRVVRFKTRRWWANRWKHRLVFDEGLAGAFVRSVWAHLKRPQSIAG